MLGYHLVELGEGGNITGLNFGLENRAVDDWGDLPDSYKTTAANNGPHHTVVPGFHLGLGVDGEVDGIPTNLASGEGLTGDNDDGVLIVSNGGVLKTGTNTLRVTVAGVGGLLTGWMDFNNDGHFDESERLTWSLNGTSLGGEADLNPGTYDLQITVPSNTGTGPIAARFRWGEQGLTFTGPAVIGEVEDYRFGLNFLFGDYNRNGTVDQADFNVWRSTLGQTVTPFAGADGNGDGIINNADNDVWRANFGNTLPGPGAGAGAGALLVDNSSSSSSGVGSGSAVLDYDSPLLTASTGSRNSSIVAAGMSTSGRNSYRPAMFSTNVAASSEAHGVFGAGIAAAASNANDLALAAAVSDDSNWYDSI
jgi:GEVED domain